jgi:hypothetical protein
LLDDRCQSKDFRSTVSTSPTCGRLSLHLETRLLASIFDTLLSSQGSDAHHRLTFRSASGATLLNYSLRSWASNPAASCWKRWFAALGSPRVTHCSTAFAASVRGVNLWDRPASRRTAVVSVPPCRADVENSRGASPQNTNPLVRALCGARRPATCGPAGAAPRARAGSPPHPAAARHRRA